MSTQPIDDGGTAFPHTTVNNMGGFVLQPGMSLRDWFAGMAITNAYMLYDDTFERTVCDEAYNEAATNAYRIADAMIEARKKDYIIDRGEDK
jgi:hypothetical protein